MQIKRARSFVHINTNTTVVGTVLRMYKEKVIKITVTCRTKVVKIHEMSRLNYRVEMEVVNSSSTWELNLCPQPSTMQRKGLFPPWLRTWRSSQEREQDDLSYTLQPFHRQTNVSQRDWVFTCFVWNQPFTLKSHSNNSLWSKPYSLPIKYIIG